MLIYLLLLAVAIIYSFQDYKKQVRAAIALMFVMMLMCGLRGEFVGTDTAAYMLYAEGYTRMKDLGFIYEFLRLLSSRIGDSPNIFLMLMAMLTYIPLTILIVKESEKPAVSVLFYMVATGIFFLETLNIARQAIAIVFVLWSAFFLKENKILWSVLFFVFSFCFHPYVFPFALIYILYKVNLRENVVVICLVLSFVVGYIGVLDQIADGVRLLYELTENSESVIINHLGKYENKNYVNISNFIGKMTHMLPVTLLCWFSYDRKSSSSDIYYKMLLLGAIVTNLFVSTLYCERIASTFTLAQILVVPTALKNLGQKSWKLLVVIGITVLLYVFTLWSINTKPRNYAKTVPYSTCFQKTY